MRTIWKYNIEPETRIEVPRQAKILSIQTQRGNPVMWMEVDTNEPKEKRLFLAFGTGHKLPDDMKHLHYVGSFQVENEMLVYHVYEVLA
jgi:hypothetical protein